MLHADTAAKEFYDRHFAGAADSGFYQRLRGNPETHPYHATLVKLVRQYALEKSRCLEIGCGTGALQDVVPNYTGCDLSGTVSGWLLKPFYESSATDLPFKANSFDALWSFATLEHIIEPERALSEMRRVLKPGGILILKPAWNCRSWASRGYHVRAYSDFNLWGKVVKSTIPIRNALAFRASYTLPRRIMSLALHSVSRGPVALRIRRLTPSYERYWCADCDAAASIDPFDAVLWFRSRGDVCLPERSVTSDLFLRSPVLVVRIRKNTHQ